MFSGGSQAIFQTFHFTVRIMSTQENSSTSPTRLSYMKFSQIVVDNSAWQKKENRNVYIGMFDWKQQCVMPVATHFQFTIYFFSGIFIRID